MDVNKEKCIGCGACVATCENLFEINDNGVAQIKKQPETDTEKECASNAMEICPVDAIE